MSSFISLTPTEKAFLDGTRQFTNAQKRYIRCRLNKKLSHFDKELTELQRCSVAAAATLQRMSVTAATGVRPIVLP
jgi:hypothetical protein